MSNDELRESALDALDALDTELRAQHGVGLRDLFGDEVDVESIGTGADGDTGTDGSTSSRAFRDSTLGKVAREARTRQQGGGR